MPKFNLMLNYNPVLLIVLLFISCSNNSQILEEVFALPKKISESSAVEVPEKTGAIWTLEDSGNKPELYALDKKGEITNTLALTNVKNNDWEDLTSDLEGNLYIGDFGNNDNDRKNLSIYKVSHTDLNKKEAAVSQTITFYYPAQTEFPPKKSERFFDSEAFFISGDFFYLFTKNRSSRFDGTTQLYKVPNKPGNHAAELIGSFQTCGNFNHCAVTAADISPDGKKVVLLSGDKIWVFENFKGDNFLSGKVTQTDLGHFSQKEGVCFNGNSELYITDEKDKKNGGFLYKVSLKN